MRKIITAAIVPAAMLALSGCNKAEAPAENAVVTDEVVAPSEVVDNMANATDNMANATDNMANATDQGSTDHREVGVDGSTDHNN